MHCKRLLQQGFTLLELLVTIAIAAIVAAIAMPSMQGILGGSEITATSNHLVYSLQSARSEAIKRITPVGLCPSADPLAATPDCGGNYSDGWIIFVDLDADGKRSSGDEVILRSEALSPAFMVKPDSVYANTVLFSISGTSVNSTGTPISGDIDISHAATEEKRAIRIAASGRIASFIPSVAVDTAPSVEAEVEESS